MKKSFLSFLFLVTCQTLQAAITVIGSASSGYTSSSASSTTVSVTVSHTQASGTNRILEVSVAMWWQDVYGEGRTVTITATYNSIAMTKIINNIITYSGDHAETCKFILKEASLPANGTYNVVVTVSISGAAVTYPRDLAAVARHLAGVDQSTTTRDADSTGSATVGTSTSLTLTTISGDVCTDALNTYTTTRTIGANQSVLGTQADGTDATDCHASYETSTTTSTTMSWTFTSQEYSYVAVAYIPAAVSGRRIRRIKYF